MSCPFPGMDPYIERPAIWPDFHDRFVGIVCASLNAIVRPRYVALTQERLYVVESERPIRPDVAIIRAPVAPSRVSSSAVAIAEPDSAAVFELSREEFREPFVTIVEPAAGNRVVTAIELLSPSNKQPGAGRVSYEQQREELIAARANFVEMDLLRDGESVVRLSDEKLAAIGPFHYLVAIKRQHPARQEVYAIPVSRRLPRIAVPLDAEVPSATLDVQAAFTRCWNEGPYPELLEYDKPPPGNWSDDETAWLQNLIAKHRGDGNIS